MNFLLTNEYAFINWGDKWKKQNLKCVIVL